MAPYYLLEGTQNGPVRIKRKKKANIQTKTIQIFHPHSANQLQIYFKMNFSSNLSYSSFQKSTFNPMLKALALIKKLLCHGQSSHLGYYMTAKWSKVLCCS